MRLVCDYFHSGGEERGLGFTSLHPQDETQPRTKAYFTVQVKYGILNSGNKAILFPTANGASYSPTLQHHGTQYVALCCPLVCLSGRGT